MDLVDIDKVLDDFELEQEETKQKSLTATSIHKPTGEKCFVEEQPTAANGHMPTDVGKRFVAVSHVFSSLDDYRKDVEGLQTSMKNFQMNSTVEEIVNKKNDKAEEQLPANDKKLPKNNADSGGDDEEEEEGLFLTSSSSITTSSPSSFSSGPSPRYCSDETSSLSTESGRRPLVSGEEGDASASAPGPSKIERKESSDGQHFALSSISSGLFVENTLSSLPGMSLGMGKLEESSTSSQDIIGGGGDVTSDVSPSIVACTEEDEGKPFDGISNPAFDDDTTEEQCEEGRDGQREQTPAGEKVDGEEKAFHRNVVTFGSTMDEISDAELDSMLQEIDSEIQSSYLAQVQDQHDQKFTFEKTDCDLMSGEAGASDDLDIDDASVVQCGGGGTAFADNDGDDKTATTLDLAMSLQQKRQHELDRDSTENLDNLQNADSFSQASTIEFAELRLQSDFGPPLTATTNIPSTTPTATDVLSTAEKDVVVLTTDSVSSHEPPKPDGVVAETTVDDNKFMHSNVVAIVTEIGAHSQQRQLQRPNSLDLPSKRITLANLKETAGQTPPASRLEDANALSTSSSEDVPVDEGASGGGELASGGSLTTADFWAPIAAGSGQQIADLTFEGASVGGARELATDVASATEIISNSGSNQLGKIPPYWVPDNEASACMQCKQKFSLLKRRHHCRACGQVLCSICCSQKAKLQFLGDVEARVCVQCHLILAEMQNGAGDSASSSTVANSSPAASPIALGRPPNPNNPMEYCSMIPPHQQVNQSRAQTPISVMVPVGVLKREGAPKSGRKDKNVIFSDGIRPGCDLTALDTNWDTAMTEAAGRKLLPSGLQVSMAAIGAAQAKSNADSNSQATGSTTLVVGASSSNTSRKVAPPCDENDSYIPKEPNALPPLCIRTPTENEYKEVPNNAQLLLRLQTETLKFAVQRNFHVFAKIVKLKCCINKTIINFTTFGMHHVGQDEIVILLELDNSGQLPKDVFVHLNEIYCDADKGYPISELGFSMPKQTNFLGSREHGGFLYIRPTFQCLQELKLPEAPFLIGILIHRWEVPWAKIFPLRLMLRLGAQYRYYPSPHISIRGRDSVYAEIAQTIINFLADFRNYSYTLATIKGMYIHMEDRRTSVLVPKNRYDRIVKALNNSSDHILALGGNFSKMADGHLVCIQNMKSDCPDTHSYSTQAINIQGQPRKVTGASFIVLNGALKPASGLSGKCSIVEDGLMVQILPAKMQTIRAALKNMKNVDIVCGPIDADETQTELVSIQWTDNDIEFNVGVKSPIDGRKMDGVPSIRVSSGLNYHNANHIIRWTEVFIIQSDEESAQGKDPIDMSKLSEQIARSTSIALVSFLDLLAARGCVKLGLRATLHQDDVCYEAGSESKLPPLYMKALDNELVPTLHQQATLLQIETPIILELIFHILDK